jgi:hypothetical protein
LFQRETEPAALVRDPVFLAVEVLIDQVEELPPELGDGDFHDLQLQHDVHE